MSAQLFAALIAAIGAGLVLWYDAREQRRERDADTLNWHFNHNKTGE